jgi:hypothetical protein
MKSLRTKEVGSIENHFSNHCGSNAFRTVTMNVPAAPGGTILNGKQNVQDVFRYDHPDFRPRLGAAGRIGRARAYFKAAGLMTAEK